MALEHPTASVTGKEDWDWNRWQAQLNEDQHSRPPETDRRMIDEKAIDRLDPRRVAALEREVQELRAELDQKDRDHDFVLNHYEQLLAEKDRQLEACRSEKDTDGTSTVRSRIRSWFDAI